jgi:hypothetical protein
MEVFVVSHEFAHLVAKERIVAAVAYAHAIFVRGLALDKITPGGLAPHTGIRGMMLTEAVVIFDAAPKIQVHRVAPLFSSFDVNRLRHASAICEVLETP